jgi:hypothetical protein
MNAPALTCPSDYPSPDKAEDVPENGGDAATNSLLSQGFSRRGEAQWLGRFVIGEFQNRPGLGTGAKRARQNRRTRDQTV